MPDDPWRAWCAHQAHIIAHLEQTVHGGDATNATEAPPPSPTFAIASQCARFALAVCACSTESHGADELCETIIGEMIRTHAWLTGGFQTSEYPDTDDDIDDDTDDDDADDEAPTRAMLIADFVRDVCENCHSAILSPGVHPYHGICTAASLDKAQRYIGVSDEQLTTIALETTRCRARNGDLTLDTCPRTYEIVRDLQAGPNAAEVPIDTVFALAALTGIVLIAVEFARDKHPELNAGHAIHVVSEASPIHKTPTTTPTNAAADAEAATALVRRAAVFPLRQAPTLNALLRAHTKLCRELAAEHATTAPAERVNRRLAIMRAVCDLGRAGAQRDARTLATDRATVERAYATDVRRDYPQIPPHENLMRHLLVEMQTMWQLAACWDALVVWLVSERDARALALEWLDGDASAVAEPRERARRAIEYADEPFTEKQCAHFARALRGGGGPASEYRLPSRRALGSWLAWRTFIGNILLAPDDADDAADDSDHRDEQPTIEYEARRAIIAMIQRHQQRCRSSDDGAITDANAEDDDDDDASCWQYWAMMGAQRFLQIAAKSGGGDANASGGGDDDARTQFRLYLTPRLLWEYAADWLCEMPLDEMTLAAASSATAAHSLDFRRHRTRGAAAAAGNLNDSDDDDATPEAIPARDVRAFLTRAESAPLRRRWYCHVRDWQCDLDALWFIARNMHASARLRALEVRGEVRKRMVAALLHLVIAYGWRATLGRLFDPNAQRRAVAAGALHATPRTNVELIAVSRLGSLDSSLSAHIAAASPTPATAAAAAANDDDAPHR